MAGNSKSLLIQDRTGKRDTDQTAHAMGFYVLLFFLCFIGGIFGRSQVRIKVRETTGEGIYRKVVHALRDSLKGSGIGKGKVRKDSESGTSLEG